MRTPTMTDVALRAGVSHATVSRIINGRPGVSSQTEQRVRQAIADLEYLAPPSSQRPGRSARQSASPRHRHFALITFDRSLTEHSAFVASIYEGARRAANERGIGVSLISLDDCDAVPDWVTPDHLDGLLLHGLRSRDHLTRTAAEIPSLWLTTHEEGGSDSVLPGNEAVGKIAATYLHERGHSMVATLCSESGNPSYRVRVDAFLQTARRLGGKAQRFELRSSRRPPKTDGEPMRALVERLADLPKATRPTGLFFPSDRMAALAHAECRRLGFGPGDAFDFIGCDNESAYLDGLYPRPATVDLGTEARGRLAFELLLARIQDPSRDRKATLLLDPVLIPSPDGSPDYRKGDRKGG